MKHFGFHLGIQSEFPGSSCHIMLWFWMMKVYKDKIKSYSSFKNKQKFWGQRADEVYPVLLFKTQWFESDTYLRWFLPWVIVTVFSAGWVSLRNPLSRNLLLYINIIPFFGLRPLAVVSWWMCTPASTPCSVTLKPCCVWFLLPRCPDGPRPSTVRPCQLPCKKDCIVTPFSNWTLCPVTCDTGTMRGDPADVK